MFHKCCVENCASKRQDVKLHQFPASEKGLQKWLQCINSDRLHKLSIRELRKLFVCHKHFERKFISDKNRIHSNGYPSLISQEEIQSGEPSFSFKTRLIENLQFDHCYDQHRKHEDHTYSKYSPSKFMGKAESSLQVASGKQTPSDDSRGTQSMGEPANDRDMSYGIELSSSDDFEEPAAAVFSWQKDEILYPTEDTDMLMCPGTEKEEASGQELGDLSLYDDEPPADGRRDPAPEKHSEYQCNACGNEIIGFRYTCVQCADWDLCGACEARAAHATHYVLRVPGPRPYNEIQTVLAAVRQQLLSENLFLSGQIAEDRVKSEPEEEAPEGGPPEGGAAAARDPLRPRLSGSEGAQSAGSEYSPPRRKRRRRRHRPSHSDDSSDSDTLPDDETFVHSGSTVLFKKSEHLLNHGQTHRLTSNADNAMYTRRKPVTRFESIHPILEIDTNSLEQPNSKNQVHQPEYNVVDVPGIIYEVPGDVFGAPGCHSQAPSDIFKDPHVLQISGNILQIPDDTIISIEKMPSPDALNMDPLDIRAQEGVDNNLEERNQVLYLRVPPDTNDDALTQALQSQAFVAIQPLAIEELRRAER